MLFNAINHLSSAILHTLGRELPASPNAEAGIKVIIEVGDPYTKEVLVNSLMRDLELMLPSFRKLPDNLKLIRDSVFCCGIEYEFREPGVPTELEEITNVDQSERVHRNSPRSGSDGD